MKKLLIFIMIFTFISAVQGYSKPKDVLGYKNLKWGDSVEKVKKYFPNIEKQDNDDKEIWKEDYSEGTIEARYFSFDDKGKLYYISIIYNGDMVNKDLLKNLKKQMVSDYGSSFEEDSGSDFEMGFPYDYITYNWDFKSTLITIKYVCIYVAISKTERIKIYFEDKNKLKSLSEY